MTDERFMKKLGLFFVGEVALYLIWIWPAKLILDIGVVVVWAIWTFVLYLFLFVLDER